MGQLRRKQDKKCQSNGYVANLYTAVPVSLCSLQRGLTSPKNSAQGVDRGNDETRGRHKVVVFGEHVHVGEVAEGVHKQFGTGKKECAWNYEWQVTHLEEQ